VCSKDDCGDIDHFMKYSKLLLDCEKILKNEKWGIGCTLDEANKLNIYLKPNFPLKKIRLKVWTNKNLKKKH
jgi:hypothetical protein